MAIPARTNRDETMGETFARWLSDGSTWIGVFENQDLGHRDLGRRIALAYDDAFDDQAAIGKTHAPDRRETGPGWRYLLVAKLRDAGEAERWQNHLETAIAQRSGGR